MMDPELPYRVEYAESGESKCQECRQKIKIKKLRMGKIELSHLYDGFITKWFHIDCFFENHELLLFETIANFDNIRWEDKSLLINKIYQNETFFCKSLTYLFNFFEENGIKIIQFLQRTVYEGDEIIIPKTITLKSVDWDEMERQTNEYFILRDKLECLEDRELIDLMDKNKQFYPYRNKYISELGEERYKCKSILLDAVTDRMVFGALNYCRCNGHLVFEPNVGYKCVYFSPRFNSCQELHQEVRRSEFILPEEIRRRYKFLNNYVCQVKTRLISPSIASLKLLDQLHKEEEEEEEEIAVNTSYCGIESWTNVFQNYSKILVRTNIELNLNQYWRIQIRKDRLQEKYWLVRDWGRIGTFRGDHLVEEMTQDRCIRKFDEYYTEKRKQVMKGKYVPVTVVDFDIIKSDNSTLEHSIKNLMKLIFNENVIVEELKELGDNLEKIPMGMLSRDQVVNAVGKWNELKFILDRYGPNDGIKLLIDKSNQFYSLIPHGFGNKRPPVLDTDEALKSEWNSLKQFRKIAFPRYNSALDILFQKFNMDIKVLDEGSSDFKNIEQHIKNSYSSHDAYNIEIDKVFVVNKREEKIIQVENKKLLWHGTKIPNIAGILANGFKISPAEAEKTGCTFGKGIYFADVAFKAANFAGAKEKYPMGILLLCEVALGKAKKFSESRYVKNLPKGYDSIVVKGKYQPQNKRYCVINGIEIPLGKCQLVDEENNRKLVHNEYVIFYPNQIKIRYLVQVKFDYDKIFKMDIDDNENSSSDESID